MVSRKARLGASNIAANPKRTAPALRSTNGVVLAMAMIEATIQLFGFIGAERREDACEACLLLFLYGVEQIGCGVTMLERTSGC